MKFRLKFLLKAPASNGNSQEEEPHKEQQSNFEQPFVQPEPPQANQFQNDNAVCGIPVTGFTQSLVIGGRPAGHGEWFDTYMNFFNRIHRKIFLKAVACCFL